MNEEGQDIVVTLPCAACGEPPHERWSKTDRIYQIWCRNGHLSGACGKSMIEAREQWNRTNPARELRFIAHSLIKQAEEIEG